MRKLLKKLNQTDITLRIETELMRRYGRFELLKRELDPEDERALLVYLPSLPRARQLDWGGYWEGNTEALEERSRDLMMTSVFSLQGYLHDHE